MLPQTPTIKSLWFDVRQLDKDRCKRTAENEKIDKRPDFLHRPEILKHDILATRKSVYATFSELLAAQGARLTATEQALPAV